MPLGFTRIIPSFGGERPSGARQPPTPSSSAPAASQRKTLGGKGVIGGGKEKHGLGGKGLGKGGLKRHRKIIRDSVRGITKGDIRRIARRGGVKRISATIYDEVREAMKNKIHMILHDCTAFVQHANRKSEHGESIRPSMDRDADLYIPQSAVTVSDVIFALKRQGRPIYGFDPK